MGVSGWLSNNGTAGGGGFVVSGWVGTAGVCLLGLARDSRGIGVLVWLSKSRDSRGAVGVELSNTKRKCLAVTQPWGAFGYGSATRLRDAFGWDSHPRDVWVVVSRDGSAFGCWFDSSPQGAVGLLFRDSQTGCVWMCKFCKGAFGFVITPQKGCLFRWDSSYDVRVFCHRERVRWLLIRLDAFGVVYNQLGCVWLNKKSVRVFVCVVKLPKGAFGSAFKGVFVWLFSSLMGVFGYGYNLPLGAFGSVVNCP
ncbi:hypothetical protein Tco_1567457 [Tanacetum coccineum]